MSLQAMRKPHRRGLTLRRAVDNTLTYTALVTMSFVFLFPCLWLILASFSKSGSLYDTRGFFPASYSLQTFAALFTDDVNGLYPYKRWFFNTLYVASMSCVRGTVLVILTGYVMSRFRFKGRNAIKNLTLVLGMFPGFMSMIAVYYILKGFGLTKGPMIFLALIMVYSGSAGLGFYVSKGFFDTIPKALDEAAIVDGATKWDVFSKIIMPLSKPIIVSTIMTSFMAPWLDFIFAKVIAGADPRYYTVAIGLYTMLTKENIVNWYACFAAGAVCVSIPIAILFLYLQKYYAEGMSGAVKG